MTIVRRYIVTGRVQGVGFRQFVQKAALETGVAGWVRNLDDGSVEALVAGTPAQQSELAGFLHRGPAWAHVRSVQQEDAPVLELKGFRIR